MNNCYCYNKHIDKRATSSGFRNMDITCDLGQRCFLILTSGCCGLSKDKNWRHQEQAALSKTFPWERDNGKFFALFNQRELNVYNHRVKIGTRKQGEPAEGVVGRGCKLEIKSIIF